MDTVETVDTAQHILRRVRCNHRREGDGDSEGEGEGEKGTERREKNERSIC